MGILQEKLKQRGQQIAEAAVRRTEREIKTLLKETGAELGEKLDNIFEDLLDELNSDQRDDDESGTGRIGQR